MENQKNLAKAAAVLRRVATIAAVGNRPLWRRTLPGAILSIALSTGSFLMPAAIGLVVGHQILDQGVFSQTVAATHVYKDIKSGPAASAYRDAAVHPLLRAGMDADGFINKDRLFASWSAAGISEANATRLVVYLWAAGSVVAPSSGLPQDIAAHRFNASALEQMDLPAPDSIVYDSNQVVPVWLEASQRYLDASHHLGFGETGANFAKTAGDISPEQAREHLVHAVQQAGLASYSVPLDAMASPRAMYGHADALMQLNDELSEISGWDGQVAGLGGRVHWVPAAETGALATTSVVEDTIMIKGAAGAYSHEFIHAIDFTIAQIALVGNNHRLPLSDDHGLLRLVQDKAVNNAHHDHIRHLRQAMPDFHARIDAFRDGSRISFMPDEAALSGTLAVTSPSEIIARSFEMHLGQRALQTPEMGFSALSALNNNEAAALYGMNYMYPGTQEAQAQSAAWAGWFAALKPLALASPHEYPATLADEDAPSSQLACALSARRGSSPPSPPKGCASP